MKRTLIVFIAVLCFSALAWAQPRPVDKTTATSTTTSYEARYESGIFGSSAKEKGTLKFDDANLRVVFYKADGKEMFTIPYDALIVIYPDSKEATPQSGGAVVVSTHSRAVEVGEVLFVDLPDALFRKS